MKNPLRILFFTLLLDTITVGILIPILPIIFTDPTSPSFLLQGYSAEEQLFVVGAIGAVFGFMQFIAAPILGELSDIYGRKKLLALCVALLAIANILFGFGIATALLAVLFMSRTLAGLAGANFSIAQASIADVTKPEDRAKNFGLIGAAFGIGFIVGPVLGGLIASITHSAAAPFWFAGFLGVINTLFLWRFLPETHHERKAVTKKFSLLKGLYNIIHALKDKEAAPVYIVSFLYTCGFSFFVTYVSILLKVRFHFSESAIGIYFAFIGIAIALTQTVILRFVAKRFSERKIMLTAFPVLATAIVLYPLVPSVTCLYFLIPLSSIPQGLAFANLGALISKSVAKTEQGAALGINGSLMALAQGIVPLLAGVVSSYYGITLPFILGALFIMASWTLLLSVRNKVATSEPVLTVSH